MKKDKYYYIHKLTLFDTAEYRLRSKNETGVYQKEPSGYRLELYELYSHLDLEQLKKLVKLRDLI